MASYSQRGDQILAQVRKKQTGVIVFSESRMFENLALAHSWGERMEKELASKGIGAVIGSRLSVGELVRRHLAYQLTHRPSLGRSTIQNHEYMAQQMDAIKVSDLRAKHLVDFAIRRKAEGVGPATILSNLSPVSAAMHAAPYAHGIKVDSSEIDLALHKLKDMGLVAKSRQVVRLVDQEEEDALLAEFRRRNLMPQTEIDMVHVYRLAIALPRRAGELTRVTWKEHQPKEAHDHHPRRQAPTPEDWQRSGGAAAG